MPGPGCRHSSKTPPGVGLRSSPVTASPGRSSPGSTTGTGSATCRPSVDSCPPRPWRPRICGHAIRVRRATPCTDRPCLRPPAMASRMPGTSGAKMSACARAGRRFPLRRTCLAGRRAGATGSGPISRPRSKPSGRSMASGQMAPGSHGPGTETGQSIGAAGSPSDLVGQHFPPCRRSVLPPGPNGCGESPLTSAAGVGGPEGIDPDAIARRMPDSPGRAAREPVLLRRATDPTEPRCANF